MNPPSVSIFALWRKLTPRRKVAVVVLVAVSVPVLIAAGFWCEPGYRHYALDRALAHRYSLLARLALACGADSNGRDYRPEVTPWEPNCPVMLTVMMKDPEQLAVVLAWRPEVNFLWADGYSPLWIAVRNGDTACARLLLDAGADPDLPTWMTPRTPRELAAQSGMEDIRRLVERALRRWLRAISSPARAARSGPAARRSRPRTR